MTSLPKISVVIPTRNRAQTLQRTLDTLLQDDYPSLEIIIIDGASTDGTVDLIKSYGHKISQWVSERDGGEYFAINKGVQRATGEIVKLMSDDDVLRPGIFHKVAQYFISHPDVGILFGQSVVWEDTDGVSRRLFETIMTDESRLTLRNWLRERQSVLSLASFIRRDTFERIGPMSTDYVCGDVEYWARAASQGIKIGVIPDVVVDYHFTGMNGIITKKWGAASDIVRINMKYGSPVDVINSIWRKYIKPYTYHPLAVAVRKICRLLFGVDPAAYLHKRRGMKI